MLESQINVFYDPNHKDLQDCPAGCNMYTAEIVINPVLWDALTPFQKRFTLLHEVGHIMLQTHIEEEADAYAFDRLAGTEFQSLKQALWCLDTLLVLDVPSTRKRKQLLYQRALNWDREHQ